MSTQSSSDLISEIKDCAEFILIPSLWGIAPDAEKHLLYLNYCLLIYDSKKLGYLEKTHWKNKSKQQSL